MSVCSAPVCRCISVLMDGSSSFGLSHGLDHPQVRATMALFLRAYDHGHDGDLIIVRFGPFCGLKSDISLGPGRARMYGSAMRYRMDFQDQRTSEGINVSVAGFGASE